MSWEVIPASHRKLQLHLLPQKKIKDWIIKNVPQVQYLRYKSQSIRPSLNSAFRYFKQGEAGNSIV